MKITLYLFLILAFTTFAFGQKAAPAKPKPAAAPVAAAVKPEPIAFTSHADKFDPKRDPVADLNAASKKAQAEGKRIILDVGGEWCGWCHFLDAFFVKNAELAKLRDDNYVWLKINMSPENENKAFLSAFPAIEGYPHLFVMEKDGSFLHSQPTDVLEEGKTYNLQKMTDFLNKWAPVKTATLVKGN